MQPRGTAGKPISSGFLSDRSPNRKVSLERSMKHWAVTVVFVLTAVSISGTPPDQRVNTVCLFLQEAGNEEADEIRSIVIEDVKHEMEKRGFAIVPEQTWRMQLSEEEATSLELQQSSTALQVAERVEADIALTGSIQIENRDIILRIRGYEVSTGKLVFNREEREDRNIGIYNTISSISRELIDTLLGWAESQRDKAALSQSETSVPGREPEMRKSRESQHPPTEKIPESEAPPNAEPTEDAGEPAGEETKLDSVALQQPPERNEAKVLVTFLSKDEGAQVCLGSDQRLGTIENGKLVVEVPVDSQLAVETTKPGYHTNRENFEVDTQTGEISLCPLFKKTRFGFEVFSTSSQFLGIGAGLRLYLVPDYIMLKTDDYIYFSISSGGEDSPPAFHNDFRLQFGSYLFSPPDRRVRFGAATGTGIILSVLGKTGTQSKHSTYYDFYWDVVDLWLDFNWQKGAVFFEVESKYALGLGACLLEPGFVTELGLQLTVGWLMKF
jgi:hypothetical protein